MTETQPYLAMFGPTIAIVTGIVVNARLFAKAIRRIDQTGRIDQRSEKSSN